MVYSCDEIRKFIVLGLGAVFFAVLLFPVGIYRQEEDKRALKYKEDENFGGNLKVVAKAPLEIYEQENRELKDRTLLPSPNGRKLAFYHHKFISDLTEIDDKDYTSLVIEEKGKRRTVFAGDHTLSFFEWLDDNEIAVYQDCGTECMMVYLVETQTGRAHRFFMGGGYSWAPNKKYVLAFHDVPRDGISVGDKFGKVLFSLMREGSNTSGTVANLRAVWSPDSSKVALIIHKEGSPDLELIVLDVANRFKTTFRSNLTGREFSKLSWRGPRNLTYNSDGKEHLITL